MTKAPAVFHTALDQLYSWMLDEDQPDGMTTIKSKGEEGKPAVCADLSIIIYQENEEAAEQLALPGTDG